ncbi:hypothetical protein DPMN_168665, partial [Dreissena polymorpha]
SLVTTNDHLLKKLDGTRERHQHRANVIPFPVYFVPLPAHIIPIPAHIIPLRSNGIPEPAHGITLRADNKKDIVAASSSHIGSKYRECHSRMGSSYLTPHRSMTRAAENIALPVVIGKIQVRFSRAAPKGITMLLAVSFLLFVTLCGTVSSQTYKGYPPIRPYPIKSCYNVYCPTVYCHGQYIPKGECCPRCPKGVRVFVYVPACVSGMVIKIQMHIGLEESEMTSFDNKANTGMI